MRYGFSGAINGQLSATAMATGAVGEATAICVGSYLTSVSGTPGRVQWLRNFWAYNSGAITVLSLYDAAAGGTPTATSNKKADIACASGITTAVEFTSPGLKFSTSICVNRQATTVSSNFGAGQVGGSVYEE